MKESQYKQRMTIPPFSLIIEWQARKSKKEQQITIIWR
jgi:hypothetical protein